MTEPVERVDREELNVSRRELMGGSAVVAGAAVLGAVPSSVLAQSDPSDEISGTVTDAGGPAQGATVVAVPHDESLDPLVTTTDANGDYLFDNGDLYEGEELYHVIARDGAEADPRRGQQNYPFIAAVGTDIPDSEGLHAHWDVTQESLSDGDPISSLTDQSGNGNDLSAIGSPTANSDGIGTNITASLDGTDDGFEWTPPTSISQPYTLFFVARLRSVGTFQEVWRTRPNNNYFVDNGGEASWTLYLGNNTILSSSSVDTSPHVFGNFAKSTDETFVDGTQEASGNSGGDDLQGTFYVGHDPDSSRHVPLEVGEMLLYNQDKSGSRTELEQYLADKWDITL